VANVEKVTLKSDPVKVKDRLKIKLDIPKSFQNKTCDIYLLSMNQAMSDPRFELKTKKLRSRETFSVDIKDRVNSFVILVEPVSNHCIYATVSQ